MKKMFWTAFVFLIAFNIPAIAISSDYNLSSSMNYFNDYIIECRNQSKVVIENLEKYAVIDMERYDINSELSHALETSVLRLIDLFDIYYLYDRLRSCATDKERKYIEMKGTQFLSLYKNKVLLDINNVKLHQLKKKKYYDEYENWLKYINRLSELCNFVGNSINFNFK